MKTKLKKLICLFLCLSIAFSLCFTAVAATNEAGKDPSFFTKASEGVSNFFYDIGEAFEKLSCLIKGEEYIRISRRSFSCQREGLTIRGYEYRPEGEKLPIAIVSHEFMANKHFVKDYAKLLARMGYAAFCYDFCGGSLILGKSDGETTDMSVLTEMKDLKAVTEYAKSLDYTDEKNITLMGCSQGGFVSALVAAELKEEISKLVLFYPALCIPDDARSGKMMLAEFDPENIPDIINCGPMKLGGDYVRDVIEMDAVKEITGYNGDVLLVHGTDDDIVNLSYAKQAHAGYSERPEGTITFEIIEGAGHIFSPKYDKIAKGYLKEFMALK